MPENKDELLKKQNEEIQKLKKELKQASKPSSMFSVLKNTVKRNVHDFFIREDRMKNMDSKIKNLEKELAKKEEELNKHQPNYLLLSISANQTLRATAAMKRAVTTQKVNQTPQHRTDQSSRRLQRMQSKSILARLT